MDKIIKKKKKKLDNLEEKMYKKIGNLNIRVNQMQNQLSKKLDSLFDLIRRYKAERFENNKKIFLRRKRHR